MRDAVICEPIRTAVGRYGGALRDVPVADLAANVVKELVRRTGLTGDDVDDVVFRRVYPNSEAPAIGRIASSTPGSGSMSRAVSWTGAVALARRP